MAILDGVQLTPELEAICAPGGWELLEWDLSDLDAHLRDSYMAHTFQLTDGRKLILVPVGQDPTERLFAVARLIDYMGRRK